MHAEISVRVLCCCGRLTRMSCIWSRNTIPLEAGGFCLRSAHVNCVKLEKRTQIATLPTSEFGRIFPLFFVFSPLIVWSTAIYPFSSLRQDCRFIFCQHRSTHFSLNEDGYSICSCDYWLSSMNVTCIFVRTLCMSLMTPSQADNLASSSSNPGISSIFIAYLMKCEPFARSRGHFCFLRDIEHIISFTRTFAVQYCLIRLPRIPNSPQADGTYLLIPNWTSSSFWSVSRSYKSRKMLFQVQSIFDISWVFLYK